MSPQLNAALHGGYGPIQAIVASSRRTLFIRYWRTMWAAPMPYTLADLACWLDPADMRAVPEPKLETGLGRNCTLFDYVRHVAYRIIRPFLEARDREGYGAHLLVAAVEFNASFGAPLFPQEVRSVVRSVVKGTWAYFNGRRRGNSRSFIECQSERGRWSGAARLRPALERRSSLGSLLSDSGSYDPLRLGTTDDILIVEKLAADLGVSRATVMRDLAVVRGKPSRGSVVDKPVIVFGKTMTMTDAAVAAGVSTATYSRRMARGIDPSVAMLMPARDGRRTHSFKALGIDIAELMRLANEVAARDFAGPNFEAKMMEPVA
jgi:Primase C terminal 1 (PriCT-1)